jgi:hypothetical protein
LFPHFGKDFAGGTRASGGYVLVALANAFSLVGESSGIEEVLVGFGGENLLGCGGGVEACGAEVGGEGVRDVDGHLHGVRVAFGRGVSGKI